jgi:hypothetical protein
METPPVNRHHTFWARRRYTTSLEKEFRNHKGLVIPCWIPAHKLLHIEVPPPPKPPVELMRAMLDNLNQIELEDRLDGLLHTIDFLDTLEGKTEHRLTTNLTKQLGYLTMRGVGNEIQEMVA